MELELESWADSWYRTQQLDTPTGPCVRPLPLPAGKPQYYYHLAPSLSLTVDPVLGASRNGKEDAAVRARVDLKGLHGLRRARKVLIMKGEDMETWLVGM